MFQKSSPTHSHNTHKFNSGHYSEPLIHRNEIEIQQSPFCNQDNCLIEKISCLFDVALINAQSELDSLINQNVDPKELNDIMTAKSIIEAGKKGIDEIIVEKYKNYANIKFAGFSDEKKTKNV